VVLGMALGAVGGGVLMKIGRRKAIFVACGIGMIGILTTQNFNFTSLMIGRFIYGYSVGLFSSICPRVLEETSPPHIYESVAATFCFSQTIGTISAYSLGSLLPADTDTDALMATERWRVIYAYYPLSLYILVILG